MGAPLPSAPGDTPASGTVAPTESQPAEADPQQDNKIIQQMKQMVGQLADKELAGLLGQAFEQIQNQMQGGQQMQQASGLQQQGTAV